MVMESIEGNVILQYLNLNNKQQSLYLIEILSNTIDAPWNQNKDYFRRKIRNLNQINILSYLGILKEILKEKLRLEEKELNSFSHFQILISNNE